MMKPSEIHVWRAPLNGPAPRQWPPPTAGEAARAEKFATPDLQRRYLRSHAALRSVLSGLADAPLTFGRGPHGKPYLTEAPQLCFNLAHSADLALVAVTLEVEVGVDVERYRPLPDYEAIASRFFPPSEAAGLTDQRDFFLRWTRIEAVLKAKGVGIYGAGTEFEGEWTVSQLDVGEEYAAAVAAMGNGMSVTMHEFGANE